MIIKRRSHRKHFTTRKEEYFPINTKITAPKVQVVGSGIVSNVCSLQEALALAKEQGLDLIQISSKGEYPICKVMNASKFRYERQKTQKAKERANKTNLKEIRITPTIGTHDFELRKRHAIRFLEKGSSVRVQVFFKRRRDFNMYKKQGESRLQALIEALEEKGGKKKHDVKLLGMKIFTIIDPTRSANSASCRKQKQTRPLKNVSL